MRTGTGDDKVKVRDLALNPRKDSAIGEVGTEA